MADKHDFTVRLEDLETMATYLATDSKNLGDASVQYTDAIPDQSVAMFGPRHTDTLYSDFNRRYGAMSSAFFRVLTDLSDNLEQSSEALREIVSRYREADQKSTSSFTSIHQELTAR